MAEKIIVVISIDGATSIEGEGFSGSVCDATLRKVADELGEVKEVKRKPEFYASQAAKQATKA